MPITLFVLASISQCIVSIASAQQNKIPPTKEQTQEWISEKVRQYSNGQTNRYGITFKDDNMLIQQSTYIELKAGTQELHGILTIPIKLIESVSFSENEAVYFLSINMKNGANVILQKFEDLPSEYVSYYQIVLPKSINDENLKERLTKAFNRLVEIYTGKTKKEPF